MRCDGVYNLCVLILKVRGIGGICGCEGLIDGNEHHRVGQLKINTVGPQFSNDQCIFGEYHSTR